MTAKENTLLKAKSSVSWIYTNLLGSKANFELLHPTELKHAEEEYVAWVLHLLPIEQALTELEQALTPPTADEVCKALSEYYGELIFYNGLIFHNARETAQVLLDELLGELIEKKQYDLITLIGRFYEVQE